jgi:ribosomal protein S18 acetylase RimI-like enzyme
MQKNSRKKIRFTRAKRRAVEADFNGGAISSDAGLLLLRETDRKFGFIRSVARRIEDKRQDGKVRHSVETMIRQRVMGICAGWEDMNDAETLAKDPVHQLAAGRDALASVPTLCRFENAQSRATAWAVMTELVERFIASHEKPPAHLILDFDATDTPVHGKQEGRFFHGYYDTYCFLPLYVFCGDQLLVAYLRPSNIDPARHAAAILKLLVTRLRQAWPRVKIVFRGDSGFCRALLLSWCDRHDVKYIVGIARNERLLAIGAKLMREAERQFRRTGKKQRLFGAYDYAALTWKRLRWVIVKAEHTDKGANPRFIITNVVGDPQRLYDRRYCARGEMENRVKEQMMLFADRVSAHRWWANQWRLLLSAIAYTLMETIRRLALSGTELAEATVDTIRTKLVKIGAVIETKLSLIRFHLSSHHPLQHLFRHAARVLCPD